MSAISMQANGPAMTWLTSSTRIPCSGRCFESVTSSLLCRSSESNRSAWSGVASGFLTSLSATDQAAARMPGAWLVSRIAKPGGAHRLGRSAEKLAHYVAQGLLLSVPLDAGQDVAAVVPVALELGRRKRFFGMETAQDVGRHQAHTQAMAHHGQHGVETADGEIVGEQPPAAAVRALHGGQDRGALTETHDREIEDIVDSDGSVGKLEMRAVIDQHQAVLLVRGLREIQEAAFLLVDADVDHFVAQQLLHDLAVLLDDLQGDAGIFALDAGNVAGQELDDDGLGRPDDDAAVEALLESLRVALEAVDEVVDLPDVLE